MYVLYKLLNILNIRRFMDCEAYYDIFYEVLGEHPLKRWDVFRLERTFQQILKKGKLHDVGCGVGHWLKILSMEKGLNLSGSDISNDALNKAKRRLKGKRVSLKLGDVRKLKYKDKEFDQTTALEVIEHIPHWEKSVLEMIRISKKRIVITVPYNERLSYGKCPECGKEVFIDGHLHKFKEKDFLRFRKYGKVSFERIFHPYKFRDFLRRGLKLFLMKRKRDGEELTLKVVCQNCYKKISYKKYSLRIGNRLYKFFTRKPEYLLVRIDLDYSQGH